MTPTEQKATSATSPPSEPAMDTRRDKPSCSMKIRRKFWFFVFLMFTGFLLLLAGYPWLFENVINPMFDITISGEHIRLIIWTKTVFATIQFDKLHDYSQGEIPCDSTKIINGIIETYADKEIPLQDLLRISGALGGGSVPYIPSNDIIYNQKEKISSQDMLRIVETFSGGQVSEVRPLSSKENIWIFLANGFEAVSSNTVVAATRNVDLSAVCPSDASDMRIRVFPKPDKLCALRHFAALLLKDGTVVICYPSKRNHEDVDGYNAIATKVKPYWIQDNGSREPEHPTYLYP